MLTSISDTETDQILDSTTFFVYYSVLISLLACNFLFSDFKQFLVSQSFVSFFKFQFQISIFLVSRFTSDFIIGITKSQFLFFNYFLISIFSFIFQISIQIYQISILVSNFTSDFIIGITNSQFLFFNYFLISNFIFIFQISIFSIKFYIRLHYWYNKISIFVYQQFSMF